MIAEGADGPTSLEGDEILAERGIPILPDILTNAGGVTVSYFEWVQDLGRLFWGRDEIREKLAEKLNDAFDRVWEISQERGRSRSAPRRSWPGSARSRRRSTPAASIRDASKVRDAMVADPPHARRRRRARRRRARCCTGPEVRAVLRQRRGAGFLGVVTRKTLVREIVAAGRDPRATDGAAGWSLRWPLNTIGSELPLDEAFRFLEEQDLERVAGARGRTARRRALTGGACSDGWRRTSHRPRTRASSRCRRRAALRPLPAPAARPRRARPRGGCPRSLASIVGEVVEIEHLGTGLPRRRRSPAPAPAR